MFPKFYSNDSTINPLQRPITKTEDTWIASILNVGGVTGPLAFLYITDKFGRKPALLCIAVPITISYLISAFAKEVYLFYIARILAGFSSGGSYALIPNYVAEISDDNKRGQMSQILNVFYAFGNFIIYSVGPFLKAREFNIILSCLPATFIIIFTLLAPESPYYLVAKGRIDDATKSLMFLRGKNEKGVDTEITEIQKTLGEEEEDTHIELLMDKSIRKAFFICLTLVLTQDLCGFTAILYYMQLIFEAAGMTLSSDYCSLILAVFVFTSSLVSPFFVERNGRRPLIIVSCFGSSFSLIILGGYFYAKNVPSYLMWVPIVSLVLFTFAFNFGISSVPFTLISEMFPNKIRNIISTIILLIGWIISFAVTGSFNSMNDIIGRAGTFWIFAGFSFLVGVFSVLFVPETKGKSFAEIQTMLETGPTLQIFNRKN